MNKNHVIRVGDRFYELKNQLRTVVVVDQNPATRKVRIQTITNGPNKRVGVRTWITETSFRERYEPVAVG